MAIIIIIITISYESISWIYIITNLAAAIDDDVRERKMGEKEIKL